jgi:ubiquitin carboxyl-terminal hydrolase L5
MGIEDEALAMLAPSPSEVYGLVFLFRYRRSDYASDSRLPQQASLDSQLWFAKQTVNDACATQAILGILLNNENISLGPMLTNFKDFTSGLPPDMRGDAIGQNMNIRNAHNSFARPEPFVSDGKKKAEDGDDVFHFVAYLPKNGKVVEIDGLQESAIVLGDSSDSAVVDSSVGWMAHAQAALRERFAKLGAAETHFNLMAIVQNKGKAAAAALTAEEAKPGGGDDGVKNQLQSTIVEEAAKHKKWKEENLRRRHNYVPFIVRMFQILARQGKLASVFDAAKTTVEERAKKEAERKAKKEASTD